MFKLKNKTFVILNKSLKKDWIILLVFFIMSVAFAGQVSSFVYATDKDDSVFSKMYYLDIYYHKNGSIGGNPQHYIGINNMIYFLLSGPIIVYVLFYFMLAFTIHFLLEAYSKKITIWLTTPISRQKLFLSKLLSIYIEIIIILSPILLTSFIFIFKNEAIDSTDYLNYLTQLVSFIIFVLLLTSLYALVYLYLFEYIKTVNFIFFAITLAMIGVFIADNVIKYNSVDGFVSKMFYYIDIFNLAGNQFDTKKTNIWIPDPEKNIYMINKVNPKHNYLQGWLFIIFGSCLACFVFFIDLKKFKKIDFNI
ncbi:hypothetical protein [Spiroplasma endosymbiont of Aspidapion aeneum]|uniref:hypothetical protein n=1 Tax=Spiroplasma endosymbiont of Aspidapion aeneum TaxID=3066276 RepID=UPI00313E7D17